MYKKLKRMCTAIVLLIKPFVQRRCRCRRGFLKFPNVNETPDNSTMSPLYKTLHDNIPGIMGE